MVAVTARAGAQAAGVRAGLRLGQREAADMLAARQRRRKRSFCSSVPNFRIGMQATELCTLMMVEQAPLPAAISSSATA